jgi:predicted nucleotidyltransferase
MNTPTATDILKLLNAHADDLYGLGARKLGLFGSYRHDTATPDSDMDLLVVLARPSFDDYMDLKFFLEDLFERQIDLVLEENLKPRLRARILDEALYVERLSAADS